MSTAGKSSKQPISPAVRKRLQQWFESGNRSSSKGDFDYATDMFTQCVMSDPGNPIYTQGFLNNLFRKYNHNKKGSKLAGLKGAAAKGSLKKAELQKNWLDVIKSGLDFLKLNPWDTSALSSMGEASMHLEFDECALVYLKTAIDANPKDAQITRLMARALEHNGEFDQAIACWRKVASENKNDDEANKAIATLTIQKTLDQGGYESKAKDGTGTAADAARFVGAGPSVSRKTPEQQLERAIEKEPANIDNYRRLAEMHLRKEKFQEAEEVLKKALDASGGELSIRESIEDIQLRRAREQVSSAERKAQSEKTEQAENLVKRLRAELNRKETQVFAGRCERYPNNPTLKYELGLRLRRAGNYSEAIKHFQEARSDSKHRAEVFLYLGECFQKIEQYKLAMSNYLEALGAVGARDQDLRKLILYRAGKLSLGQQEWATAEKHLTELAGLDYGYKDVPTLLDKLGKIRDK